LQNFVAVVTLLDEADEVHLWREFIFYLIEADRNPGASSDND
jgi:hypothetical protein